VLGNHDLSLLAIGERSPDEQRKVNPDLQRVVLADDARMLLDWLRMQKLLHVDRDLGWMMVHAGLAPKWTTTLARSTRAKSRRNCTATATASCSATCTATSRTGRRSCPAHDRSRAIINVLTRMRYCTPRGRMAIEEKGAPGRQAQGLYPWYEVPGRAERDLKIVCGHWSTLGLMIGHGVHAIDTGAVWGGKLTALQLDTDEIRLVQVPAATDRGRPKGELPKD
jgi:bis(5'-nucleosyl)-tetraphosphatase (symmetrical)